MTYARLILALIALALLATAASAGDPPAPRTADSAVTPFDRNPKRHEGFLKRIKATAEQLTQVARWRLILSAAFQYFLRGKVLGSVGHLAEATG